MFISKIREAGITSDALYAAAAASIGLSIALWFSQKDKDAAHAERFGIFVGLWAPTLALLGNALQMQEEAFNMPSGGVTSLNGQMSPSSDAVPMTPDTPAAQI